MDWTETQKMTAEWSKKTFKQSSPNSCIAHLRDELDEVEEDLANLEEWADAMILLMNAAYHSGVTMDELLNAVHKKHKKNTKRIWGTPDERGVVRHID